MVSSMEKYEALLRDFLIVAKKHITPVALEELKIFYANFINSVRTLHRINDVDHLVRVLENRGVIRYDNITPLKDIAKKYFKSSPIYQRLEDYHQDNAFSYPARTNLYRIGNGEFYIRNRFLNNLSLSSESENRSHPIDSNLQSCLEYKFACKLPFHIISEKESSNYDNSTVLTSSFNDRSNTGVLFENNFINKNNCNNHNLHVIHNVTIPPNLVSKKEQTVIIPDKTVTPLLAEENFNQINNDRETSSSSTPNSDESQTTCSSQIENKISDDYRSLINSSGSKNLNVENFSRKLIRNKKIWIFLSAVYLVLLSTPIIIFCLLKYPVQYNPEPSAPSFQEVHSGTTEPPVNPYAGHHVPWNQNVTHLQNQSQEYSGRGLTCFPVVPRLHQPTISKMEQTKQHIIFERISEQMGTYWLDVARLLDVREFEINKIEAQYNCDLTVKAYTALKIFARDGDPDNWQRVLRKALEKARRKDLAELVEELSSRRY